MMSTVSSQEPQVSPVKNSLEYSLAVWAPLVDANAIRLVVEKCFGTPSPGIIGQQPGLEYQPEDLDYPLAGPSCPPVGLECPLVAAVNFVGADGLTPQRVKHLSERLPKALIHLSTAFVAKDAGGVVSRITVAYRGGKEQHCFFEASERSGGISSNWLKSLALGELEAAYSLLRLSLCGGLKWFERGSIQDHLSRYHAFKSTLTAEEWAECVSREAQLSTEARRAS